MKRISASFALLVGVLVSVAVPGSATAQTDDCTRVKATLIDYKIKLNKKRVDAGCVEFRVVNRGVEDHELVVTEGRRARDLPQRRGVVDEDQIEVLDEVEELATLERGTLRFDDMAKGKYVLFCNLEHEEDGAHEFKSDGHFGEGMHVIFTVR